MARGQGCPGVACNQALFLLISRWLLLPPSVLRVATGWSPSTGHPMTAQVRLQQRWALQAC